MPNEIELKLRIDPAHAPQLRRHPAILAYLVSKPVTRKLTSIYYDTPDLQLLDAGISLRVRRMSGGWFQAVKAKGNALAGLHQRMEWEDIIAAGHPDFSKITEPALIRIFDHDNLRHALAPIFVTEVRRTEWQLLMPDGSQIEMALDLGELKVHDKTETIEEIELELKHGEPLQLFELALALQSKIPLHIENISKAQRGYSYYRPALPRIVKACPVVLDKHMYADEAFRHIGWECLAQLQSNQVMVLHGDDPEGVHQMRVALRRLRSAMGVFRSILDIRQSATIQAELRWIASELAAARDLDVFLTETLPPIIKHFDSHPGLLAIQNKAITVQIHAYDAARTAIQSQRYQQLLLSLGAWLQGGQLDKPVRITEIAQAILRKRNKQLRRHGRLLHEVNTEERHLARIAGKKLRYAAEFLACLYPTSKTVPFLQGLAGLQDVLGTLNDIAVTQALLQNLADHRPSRLQTEALHIIAGWGGCHAMHKLAHLESAWKKFAIELPFWS